MPNASLIHADIFFFISTIALALISVGIIIVLVYAIKIIRNVSDISDKVKAESAELVADLRKLRASLRDEGVKWKHVVDLVRTFFMRNAEKAARKERKARVE